jgi:hypothetical protein
MLTTNPRPQKQEGINAHRKKMAYQIHPRQNQTAEQSLALNGVKQRTATIRSTHNQG